MTHLLIGIGLAIAFLLWGRSRRTTRMTRLPAPLRIQPGQPALSSSAPPEIRRDKSVPKPTVAHPAPGRPAIYLLDGHGDTATNDTTAALMDMMEGPGLCTPGSRPAP